MGTGAVTVGASGTGITGAEEVETPSPMDTSDTRINGRSIMAVSFQNCSSRR
jgi:hypothetical protein